MGINVDCIEVYKTQSKNGIMMNVGVWVKKLHWGSWKNNYIRNPSPSNCQYNKACEDEILNATNTSLADKKCNNMKKNKCLIHIISLVIICLLLLAVISISCYYYYTKNQIKNKSTLSY